jgi:protoporphyrinogen oxidase
VAVIGAGATGLAAAYMLARAGQRVTLIDAAPQPGGLLATFDAGGGSPLERFYHHFFTHDAEINWLLRELGLADRVIFQQTSMGMYRGGAIYPFNGVRDLLRFRAIPLMARLRFALTSAALAYVPGYADAEATAALAWFQRRAGAAATAAIWGPMLDVKFGAVAGHVPLAWMAGRLRQRVRSRQGGTEHLGYLRGSLQVLVDALVADLRQRGAELRLATSVDRLLASQGKVIGVATSSGPLFADAVLATAPAGALARWVRPLDATFASRLESIRYLGVICTVLALRQRLSPVYWLNVADPGFDFGGVIEQTHLVPPKTYRGRHLVYLSKYLSTDDRLWSLSDQAVLDLQVAQLSRLFRRDVHALLEQGWVFRGAHAAPRTVIGFHRSIPPFRSPVPGLFVANMCQVYPDERSVSNSIRIAAEAVRALGLTAAADRVPRGLSLAGKYGF